MADQKNTQGKTADQAGTFKQTDAKLGADTKATGKTGQVNVSVKPGDTNTGNLKK